MTGEFKNLLYPTDFSMNADNALPFAIDLVKRINGTLNVLNVYQVPVMAPYNKFTTREQTMLLYARDMEASSFSELNKIIEKYKLSDIQPRCLVREGGTEEQILNVIDEENIHLVVTGNMGVGTDKSLFIGSNAKALLQQAHCPVLAIPEKSGFRKFSKIVFATDLLTKDDIVLNFIIRLARLYDATIFVLHVDYHYNTGEWSIEELKKTVKKADYAKITYREVVAPDVKYGINKQIRDLGADLLVMTTHTNSLYSKLFHHSHTKDMLLHSHIPFLGFNRNKYNTIFLG